MGGAPTLLQPPLVAQRRRERTVREAPQTTYAAAGPAVAVRPARLGGGRLQPMEVAHFHPWRDSGRGGHAVGQHGRPRGLLSVAGHPVASWHRRLGVSKE